MSRTSAVLRATTVTVAFVALAASPAFASGHHSHGHGHGHGPPTATPAGGTVSCAVKASLVFTPPLQASASGTSTVTLNAQLVQCSTTSSMHRTTGHITGASLGTIPSNTCTGPTPPSFSAIGLRWTPPKKVADSSISDTNSGTLGTTSGGQATVSYGGISVTGSFGTSSGTLNMTSRDTVANYGTACSSSTGLGAITFGGRASL
jgi:hypothetical protein